MAEANSLLKLYGAKHVDAISDNFHSLEDVESAVRQAGLESCNLIFGVDYTASNKHQGKETFQGRSLHHVEAGIENPYQQVIRVLGRTLINFDDDNIIPAFGFGDANTKDKAVFPLKTEGYCEGFEDVLKAYNAVTSMVALSGPTSFVPLINKAIDIVQKEKGYHILVIAADGQVTSEKPTREAIVNASKYPLSIILVGVGDGPWDMMKEFDDGLPARQFDNFQFVEFHKIFQKGKDEQHAECVFALNALMEIPDQFKAIRRLGLLDM